jgi:pyridoxal biosynthesis lyase PdxS
MAGRVPADIRAQGGVARMSDPELVIQIRSCHDSGDGEMPHRPFRRGILQSLGIDYRRVQC